MCFGKLLRRFLLAFCLNFGIDIFANVFIQATELRKIECKTHIKSLVDFTSQKMKFSIKGFFGKCDQIRRKLQIWSHSPKKSIMENFIFCAVFDVEMQITSCKFKTKVHVLVIDITVHFLLEANKHILINAFKSGYPYFYISANRMNGGIICQLLREVFLILI